MDVMLNMNFAVSSKNKDQLRDLYNYLNQNVITAINTLDGSTFGDNLITSHQGQIFVYCCSFLFVYAY